MHYVDRWNLLADTVEYPYDWSGARAAFNFKKRVSVLHNGDRPTVGCGIYFHLIQIDVWGPFHFVKLHFPANNKGPNISHNTRKVHFSHASRWMKDVFLSPDQGHNSTWRSLLVPKWTIHRYCTAATFSNLLIFIYKTISTIITSARAILVVGFVVVQWAFCKLSVETDPI